MTMVVRLMFDSVRVPFVGAALASDRVVVLCIVIVFACSCGCDCCFSCRGNVSSAAWSCVCCVMYLGLRLLVLLSTLHLFKVGVFMSFALCLFV